MHGPTTGSETERSYRILELDQGASRRDVEISWRKLVDEWAPDRFRDDAVLLARAESRVKSLNEAKEILNRQMGNETTKVVDKRPRFPSPDRHQGAFRSLRWGASLLALTGAAVAILMARPSFGVKPTLAPISATPAVERPAPARPTAAVSPVTPQLTLVARATVTVSASLVADGRILLSETTLQAGQTMSIPRLGPIYVKYSAGENLEVEINGRRYPLPDSGASRAKIN